MSNYHLFTEEGKLKIAEREKEIESYRLYQYVDDRHRRGRRWLWIFVTLAALVVIMIVL